jgi:hypothetical protein
LSSGTILSEPSREGPLLHPNPEHYINKPDPVRARIRAKMEAEDDRLVPPGQGHVAVVSMPHPLKDHAPYFDRADKSVLDFLEEYQQ